FWIDLYLGEVRGPVRHSRIAVHEIPVRAGVIRSIQAAARPGFDRREEPTGIRRRHRDANSSETVSGKSLQAAHDRLPGAPAIRRLEAPAAWPVERAVPPGRLARLPQDGVDRVGIRRIEREIGGAGVCVLIQDLGERLASVN